MQDNAESNEYKDRVAGFSDAGLDVFLKSGHSNTSMIAAAAEEYHRRKREREDVRHAQLLAEIRKPHWSVTPSFYLLVISVILTAAALFVAFKGLP